MLIHVGSEGVRVVRFSCQYESSLSNKGSEDRVLRSLALEPS